MNYSFVIPCYRSENTISAVVEEINSVAEKENLQDYEIILVNDCSPDNVWDKIKQLAEKDSHVHGINLVKNSGQHAALLAGYAKAKGGIIVSMDDDGQSPLDELRTLLEELDKGNDIVYAYYEDSAQSKFRQFGTYFATQMCKVILDAPKDFRGSSFFVLRKLIADEMVKYDHSYPYLTGLVLRTTRKIGYVKAAQRNRISGNSGYSLSKLFGLWLNGFTAFSVKPLQIGTWLGFIFALIGFIGTLAVVINKIIHPDTAMGWSSIVSINLMVSGITLVMLGLIGEYIGRIYICINKAPQYVIREETPEKDTADMH